VKRAAAAAAAAAAALALPAAAFGHAALLRTVPDASGIVNGPPAVVKLIYSEAVEPRFAIVSVTDAAGTRQTSGSPRRSPADPDEIDVPLQTLREGWYLVFWRAISVDGHPVRGAFTFAVGPNPGPSPEFAIPSLSETAATPGLIAARWLVFLSFMAAIGLFVLRAFVARPLRAPPRALTVAFAVATAVALVSVPFYVLYATSRFALRSIVDLGTLVPLMRTSAFGRGYLELEILLALFAAAAAIYLVLDRPGTKQRSIAELFALLGALLAAGAVALAPGAAGHAAQTPPRPLALALDWLHVAAGSLWVGGLLGLLVLWRSLPQLERLAGLAICVPRFSNVALGSVAILLGSGIWASVLHLPTLASLWQTSYGKAIAVKAAILLVAMAAGAVNNRRTTPALRRAAPSPAAAVLLRRLVSGEVLLVAGAVAAAAVLSSLAPPPKALASLEPDAHVGPGAVTETVTTHGYRVDVRVQPNRAAVPNDFAVRITRNDAPVRSADVTATFTMLDMEMPTQEYRLREETPGRYVHAAPALVMVGRWGLTFQIAPQRGAPFSVVLVDRANG
jgi:copper transport protein